MSGIWERYENRVTVRGSTRREDTLVREKLRLTHMLQDSLSFHTVSMYTDSIIATSEDENGFIKDNAISQNVAIINSDNLDEKYIYSLPDENIWPGDLFYWMNNYWLITDRDANHEVYTRAKALQCNYVLKWVDVIDNEPIIIEQWCNVADGTKYMTGELEDRHFIATRGDARIAITIARNKYTKNFNRTRRFLVDDSGADNLLAYDLSKPLKAGHTFNDKGIYQFVLSECSSSEFDNMELGIADYYQYFPAYPISYGPIHTTEDENNGKKVWL